MNFLSRKSRARFLRIREANIFWPFNRKSINETSPAVGSRNATFPRKKIPKVLDWVFPWHSLECRDTKSRVSTYLGYRFGVVQFDSGLEPRNMIGIHRFDPNDSVLSEDQWEEYLPRYFWEELLGNPGLTLQTTWWVVDVHVRQMNMSFGHMELGTWMIVMLYCCL